MGHMIEEEGKRAVVLLQLGGPDSLSAVEPFLYNLFSDPDIIDLPGAFLFRKPLARLISRNRAPRVQKLYESIGGKSPILDQTRQQAESLRQYLEIRGKAMPVEIAMRYWHPLTEETYSRLLAGGVEEVVLLPLYPHYSRATTGSSVREWVRVSNERTARTLHAKVVDPYFEHPLYIQGLVVRISEALMRMAPEERRKVHLLFSAHGTPMKLVREGDPYSHQIRRTYELAVESGNFDLPHHLCFQSKVGPQRWLEPSLLDTIERLAGENVTHLVVIPVAFVSDHIETLSELGIEAKHHAIRHGMKRFEVTDSLLTCDCFIECLGQLVLEQFGD